MGNCILATCADDRTVRINDGNTFYLLHILKTQHIHGWYTLTYLAINPVKNWILCSTQNGYIIIWDSVSSLSLCCEKVHCGSIEGLEWNKSFETFASVGSDCAVNLFSASSNAQQNSWTFYSGTVFAKVLHSGALDTHNPEACFYVSFILMLLRSCDYICLLFYTWL